MTTTAEVIKAMENQSNWPKPSQGIEGARPLGIGQCAYPSDCAWKIQFKSDDHDRKFEDLLSKATHTRDAIESCGRAGAGPFVHTHLDKRCNELALAIGRLVMDAQTFPCKRD